MLAPLICHTIGREVLVATEARDPRAMSEGSQHSSMEPKHHGP
jgi:hypothetical protein